MERSQEKDSDEPPGSGCEYRRRCPETYNSKKCNEEHEHCLRYRRMRALDKLGGRFDLLSNPNTDSGFKAYLELREILRLEDKRKRS